MLVEEISNRNETVNTEFLCRRISTLQKSYAQDCFERFVDLQSTCEMISQNGNLSEISDALTPVNVEHSSLYASLWNAFHDQGHKNSRENKHKKETTSRFHSSQTHLIQC